jgi:hypothetical protein
MVYCGPGSVSDFRLWKSLVLPPVPDTNQEPDQKQTVPVFSIALKILRFYVRV